MHAFEIASYLSGAVMFTILALLLVVRRLKATDAVILFAAAVLSAALFYAMAYAAFGHHVPPGLLQSMEVARNTAWFTYLFWLLGYRFDAGPEDAKRLPRLGAGLYVFAALMLGASIASPLETAGKLGLAGGAEVTLLGFVLMPVAGLVLVEQLFRNTDPDQRWAVKFMCLGIGGLFAYDFFIYADALLFKRVDPALWSVRGFVGAMVTPLVAVSVARTQDAETRVFVSKRVVFHTATLLGAGVYLLLMAGAGYYIRTFGGTWGVAFQTLFFFGAGLLLLILFFSGQVRANIKFFLNKHFFGYKYDYREEWHKLIATLSQAREAAELHQAVIKAIGDIVESTGGQLWLKDDDGGFVLTAARNMSAEVPAPEPADGSLATFLADHEWVVDIDEYQRGSGNYEGLVLPAWLVEESKAWLVVPLFHPQGMLGFLVLAESRGRLTLNWEDMDLLKTVGRQAGSYLALLAVSEALADARQFETFNRLSAYVVHDLKNLIAQLSLVVTNARKHMHNPEFVADAVQTVDNAVVKMSRLLEQLRQDRREVGPRERVEVGGLLEAVAAQKTIAGRARPVVAATGGVQVLAERERLATVLGHLVQNAQDASPADGEVLLRLKREGPSAVIEVEDRGRGMDAEFVRSKLFRPFYTTKGNAGMGIGAYESREYIRSQGGELRVDSVPGQGTVFEIRLAVAPADQQQGAQA